MKNNVVIAIFEVESEAFQAFNELRRATVGEGYAVPEAALIKNRGNVVDMLDCFSSSSADTGTATGIVVGSLIGILGGPIGVILGASAGACIGSASDADRALDAASAVAVVADKIYEGETAIVALVGEEEPAFDAAFADYKTTIVRYDAADIADDVDRLRELEAAVSEEVLEEVRADRKAARKDRRDERHARISSQLEEYAAATNRTMGNVSPM